MVTRVFHKPALVVVACVIAGFSLCTVAGAGMRPAARQMTPWEGDPPEISNLLTTPGFLADGVSSRDRLEHLRRLRAMSAKGVEAGDPDTLRIIAIRVEFEESEGMTQGRFNLEIPAEDSFLPEHIIDPPPHDRRFFMKHLEALSYYIRAQSYGQVVLDYDVFPQADSAAFVLPSISTYNPEGTHLGWSVEGLTQLYRDIIVHADTTDAAVFQDADSLSIYIVFHAGPDLQTDVAYDSPNDIPSFTIVLGDSDRFYIRRPDSLMVYDGMMIPETVSQDSRVGAINGVLAHEFGHILGALDLYNTCYWTTGIGFWGLMGSGNQVAFDLGLEIPVEGILPPSMCAWTKWWLGFLDPGTITTDGTYSLRASGFQDGTANAFRIPINEDEYFLLENRQRDLEPDRGEGIFQDRETGVVMGPVDTLRLHECRLATPDSSCFAEAWNYHYDFGLPGSGLLIWHIDDERIIETLLAAGNAINCDYWRRGVDLEEADGIRDIGNPYSWYDTGSEFDPFFRGFNDTFDPSSVPNSNSNFDAITHIAITEIDSLSVEMDFTVRIGASVPGWPVALEDSARSEANAPAVVDLDGNGVEEIVLAMGSKVWAWELDGATPVDGWPIDTGDTLLTTVAAADMDGDGRGEVVVGSATGRLYAWQGDGTALFVEADSLGGITVAAGAAIRSVVLAHLGQDLGGSYRDIVAAVGESLMVWGKAKGSLPGADSLTLRWAHGWNDTVRALAVRNMDTASIGLPSWDPLLAVLVEPGQVSLLDSAGEQLDGWPVSLDVIGAEGHIALADLDRAPGDAEEIVVVAEEGWITVLSQNGEQLPGWPVRLSNEIRSAPAIDDLDGDGYLDLAVGTAGGEIEILGYTGTPLIAWRVEGGSSPSAAFADVTGDAVAELMTSAYGHHLTAWGPDARPVWGWPLAGGGDVSLTPMVSDLDADGSAEVLVVSGDGWLKAYRVDWADSLGSAAWGSYLGNSARTGWYPRTSLPAEPAPGQIALAEADVVVYPNPCREAEVKVQYRLGFETEVKVTILDLIGQEVWSSEKVSPQGTDWIRWPVSSVASGLYLCKVEAKETSGSTIVFRKVAVVR